MLFGLINAPATSEKLMKKILFCLTPEKCLCYLDDVIDLGKNFDNAIEKVELVFQCLRVANLKLKPKKCFLFQHKVTFLGHVVSEDRITCDSLKIECVKHWPTPSNKVKYVQY